MIKRIFVFLLLYLFVAPLMYGQGEGQEWTISVSNTTSSPFSVYAEGGWLLSSFHSSGQSKSLVFSSLSGFQVGAGMHFEFLNRPSSSDKMLAIQAGLHYMRSGFSVEERKVRGGYLCMPICFQYYPLQKHAFYVEVGPEFCYNLKLSPSTIEIKGVIINLENHHANDIKIGLGAGYVIKAFSAGVSVKYMIGLSNFAENLPWKGNQFRVELFYRFGIQRWLKY